jgi:hypothetical protein
LPARRSQRAEESRGLGLMMFSFYS